MTTFPTGIETGVEANAENGTQPAPVQITKPEVVAELDADKRARFAQFADQLIAGGAGFPTASEADPEGKWLDRTLVARPDLIEVVLDVIAMDSDPSEVLAKLKDHDAEKFDLFGFAVAGAYLINPRIRKLLGYPGPAPEKSPAFPDEADAYLEDGILDVVIQRGPIYRPTPE